MNKRNRFNKLKQFLIFIILSIETNSFAQIWEQSTSFPGTPRDDAAYFQIANRHYIGTGRDENFACTKDFYFFDESTLLWGSISSLDPSNERQYATACSINGRGYLFGGVDCSNIFLNDFWSYDPISDNWNQLASLPSNGRAGMQSFILEDTIYIIGGRNNNGILNEVWAYNLNTDTWTMKNPLPIEGIWRGINFTHQNIAYIGLGKNNSNNQNGHNLNILKFKTETDSWEIVPNIDWGMRSYTGYTQKDSSLFLFGGVSSQNEILSSVEKVNLNDFSKETLPNFPSTPRKGGQTFIVQNDLYYTTGVSTVIRFNETWKLSNVANTNILPSKNINIFPNPATNWITISGIPIYLLNSNAFIFEPNGKVIFEFKILDQIQSINLPIAKKGIYLMRLGHFNFKIQIE